VNLPTNVRKVSYRYHGSDHSGSEAFR
jgi:hypothetical protein